MTMEDQFMSISDFIDFCVAERQARVDDLKQLDDNAAEYSQALNIASQVTHDINALWEIKDPLTTGMQALNDGKSTVNGTLFDTVLMITNRRLVDYFQKHHQEFSVLVSVTDPQRVDPGYLQVIRKIVEPAVKDNDTSGWDNFNIVLAEMDRNHIQPKK
ncbi:hypothetical protein [Lactobacillus selangorensis]|nr:hypothetical protein [Lactobacillus selangorensis]